MDPIDARRDDEPAIGERWPELVLALFLMLTAALVIADSLRVGIGWADDGPRSGYFPFRIGVLLLVASTWIAVALLRRWRDHTPFATRGQLRSVGQVLGPMAIYVFAIAWLGIYLPSALLIGWFMARHGKHAKWLTAAIAVGTPVLVFIVFERWFHVPLPKGPIENLLGF